MIILIKNNATEEQMQNLSEWLTQQGYGLHISHGGVTARRFWVSSATRPVLTSILCARSTSSRTSSAFRSPTKTPTASSTPPDTVVEVAGPQRSAAATSCRYRRPLLGRIRGADRARSRRRSRPAGATMLRGGAFKPRTSPYAFQGLARRGHQPAARGKEAAPACLSLPRSWMSTTLPLFERRGRHSGGRAQHAELRAAQGAGS